MATKADLHRRIDTLPDELVDEAVERLEALHSPMLRALLSAQAEDGAEALLTLYRPVGQQELDLIAAAGYRRFPPRLPRQPIFYPVLNQEYAEQIARDWNTKDPASGLVGYVTRFAMPAAFAQRYPVQRVGGAIHQELWVPAKELDEFNDNIAGMIEVIGRFPAELA